MVKAWHFVVPRVVVVMPGDEVVVSWALGVVVMTGVVVPAGGVVVS